MREIIFRGLTLENKEMVFGSLFIRDQDVHGTKGYLICASGGNTSLVDPETIGQYTGLTDKDGVRIFEGDVLSLYDEDNSTKTKDGAPVSFSHKYVGGWIINKGGNNLNIGTRAAHTKVIGTIHDKE